MEYIYNIKYYIFIFNFLINIHKIMSNKIILIINFYAPSCIIRMFASFFYHKYLYLYHKQKNFMSCTIPITII